MKSEEDYIKQADSIVSNHCGRYSNIYSSCGVLLSGGIDSSVITTYVLDHFKSVHIFSMGTDLTVDRPYVDLLTTHLGMSYEWVELKDSDITEAMSTVTDLLLQNGVDKI